MKNQSLLEIVIEQQTLMPSAVATRYASQSSTTYNFAKKVRRAYKFDVVMFTQDHQANEKVG